jgi:hypothetical protein
MFQNDLKDKLARLERLIEQQPEGTCGVPLCDKKPSDMMRSVSV